MSFQHTFYTRLKAAIKQNNSLLCVGLDPVPALFSTHIAASSSSLYEFCTAIVDATADLVCAYKPQIAHFSAVGAESQLVKVIQYVHERYPGIPVILDAKRGDIGSTAKLYAKEVFVRYSADAATVNPYLGKESIQPFLDFSDRGTVILCRTSNPDSAWLQSSPVEDPSYLKIAKAALEWQKTADVMLVAGATYPEEIQAIRKAAPGVPLLIPGVGAQGGNLEQVMKAAQIAEGELIINASRSILYASTDEHFAASARRVASNLRDEINLHRVKDCSGN